MSIRTARRLLAGLAVAGAFIAAGASPAYAAPTLHVEAHDAIVAPDGYADDYLYLYTEGDDALGTKVSVVIDSSGLEGARLDWENAASGWLCTPDSDTVMRCETPVRDEGVAGAFLDYRIHADADAQVGAEGSLAFTVKVDGLTSTAKATVTIAEPSDLSTGAEEPAIVTATGEPGGLAKANAPVANVGTSTVERTVLVIQPDFRTPYAGDFSNCVHYDAWFVVCEFDQALEPGHNYRLSTDIPYAVDKTARTGAVFTSYTDWWVEGDWKIVEKSWLEYVETSVRGKGEALRLEEVASARRGVPQTDVYPWDNGHQLDITVGGDNFVDLAAVGATATGAVGATVTVRPAVKNLGPAALESMFEEPKTPTVRITIPDGVTVVEATWECAPYTAGAAWPPDDDAWGKAGAREYGCMLWDLYPDYSNPYEFKLRVDQVVENAVGKITVALDGDPNAANNAAEIVLTGTGTGAGGGTGGNGGGDGGLPVTGPQAALIAGVGVLLVGAGAGGFVLFRRRRTRFVA